MPLNLTAASALTYIGPYAFSEAGSEAALTSHFVIGNQVTAISEKAFEAASTVTAVTIGNSVTIIFPSAFERCVNLTTVEFGRAVRVIGDLSFSQTNLVCQPFRVLLLRLQSCRPVPALLQASIEPSPRSVAIL
eukprot:m.91572 g.91572  ORF g.91572 m.91572 type:complete len:134 (-) comp11959_c0_seq1:395-796(-)